MSLATLIRRMAEAGAPPEAIALAVEEIEAIGASLESRRSADRERKRAQRERLNSANVTGHSAPCHSDVTDIPSPLSPPLKSPPDPQKITPPLTPQPPMKRACRLSTDWKPEPVTGKAAAMIAAWQAGEVERELAKFKNYWMGKAGKDAAKLDWQRTWINWLISADERKPRNGQSGISQPLPRARPNLTDIIRATSGPPDFEGGDGTRLALPAGRYG